MSFGYHEPSDIMAGVHPRSPRSRGSRQRQRFIHGQDARKILSSFAVAASDRADNRAFYSNRGPGVDAFAPESDISSAWAGSNTSTYFLISGMSMVTPHVAGLVAYLRAVGAEAPIISAFAITQRTKDLALKGLIQGSRGSPNLLINNNGGA